jgi:putative ABC transport system ATP-binding protein
MERRRPIVEGRALGRKLPSDPPKVLLQDVSFSIDPGEVLAVVGPSGSGKSSLLRILNRLDELSEGTLLLDGEDARLIDPRLLRQRIGMVMQRAYLFPGTVAENVSYGPAQHGRTISDQEIASLLGQVGLSGYERRNALTLSGGEAQRVAITRALANQPEALLLDEPTSALDEVSKAEVEQLLENLIREKHLTCIWVTHEMAQARRMADKVLLLENGRVKAFGMVQEVLK